MIIPTKKSWLWLGADRQIPIYRDEKLIIKLGGQYNMDMFPTTGRGDMFPSTTDINLINSTHIENVAIIELPNV